MTVDERQATHLLQAWTRGDRAALDRLAPLAMAEPTGETARIDVLGFDEALSRLEDRDARKARVLEAWFFSGMTAEEIAEALNIGTSTVQRDLEFAKVWVLRELGSIESHGK